MNQTGPTNGNHDLKLTLPTTQQDHRIAWLTALAITIHLVESVIPSPLPGLKPGLANVITITVLCLYGWSSAAWVSMLRVLVGSLLLGTFLSPTFLLSLAGALGSVLILWPASRLPGRGLSSIGYSVLASLAHISCQFVAAYLLFIPHPGLWKLFPVLPSFALLLGIFNGIISQTLLKRIHD